MNPNKNMSGQKKILIIDDEKDLIELIGYQLRKEGFAIESTNNPLKAISLARATSPSLVILDVMMPDLNGYQLCQLIREDEQLKNIPVIFLTAKTDSADRVKGLELGADDYLAKPFEFRELLLRVKSVLRRSGDKASVQKNILVSGKLVVDTDRFTVICNGKEASLTATEFKLLQLLMERKGRVQTRENLLVNVWNYEADIETRTVDTHVRRLREKLGDCGNIIETVRGIGYRIPEN